MWVRHGHKARLLTGAGSAVAIVGLVFVLDLLGGAPLVPIGVLWGLAAAYGLATYFVLSSKVDNDVPPVASAGMTVGAGALLGLGAIGVLPMQASYGAVDLLDRRQLVGSGPRTVARGRGDRLHRGYWRGPPARSKARHLRSLTEVILAVLFAWLLLDELPTGLQLVGGALIVIGIALVHIDELRPAGAARETPFGESADAEVDVEPMSSNRGEPANAAVSCSGACGSGEPTPPKGQQRTLR